MKKLEEKHANAKKTIDYGKGIRAFCKTGL